MIFQTIEDDQLDTIITDLIGLLEEKYFASLYLDEPNPETEQDFKSWIVVNYPALSECDHFLLYIKN
ncbi:MAG: hypothetical protein ACFCUV_22370 [Rivularia sp. (in: cyanobacteria)]